MNKPKKPWPKLSETLSYARHPWICQCCGLNLMGHPVEPHQIHRECDDEDAPTATVVVLCKTCADLIIESHPRLYAIEPKNKPVPGAIPHLCVGCTWRRDLNCTNELLKANGGPGLNIVVAQPTRGFWDGHGKDGRRTGGRLEMWPSPARSCEGATPGPE